MLFDKMILGTGVEMDTNSQEMGINSNVLVCAGSGSGKTMSIIEPRILEAKNSSFIITVTKRRIVDQYTPLFKKRGYEVFDLNLASPEKTSSSIDFLQYIKRETDIKHLAESIVMANPRKRTSTSADPYWDMMAVSLLTAEIYFVIARDACATFKDVLELNDELRLHGSDNGIETAIDNAYEAISSACPHSLGATCWNSFKCLSAKTAGCVYSALNTALDQMFPPDIRALLQNKNVLNIERLATKKTVVFLTTSPVNPALNSLVSVFYSLMFKQLFEFAESREDGKLPIPVSVLCDDFATGGRIPHFDEYISIFREKSISVVLLVQSESQLAAMYGEKECETIINNCDTYVFMGGMDLKTAKNISERLNKPLEDVLYMPVGKEVIFQRGRKPIITKRYNILEDSRYIENRKDIERNKLKRSFADMFKREQL